MSVDRSSRGADAALPPPAERGDGRGGGALITIKARSSWILADFVHLTCLLGAFPLLVCLIAFAPHPMQLANATAVGKACLGGYLVAWATLLWLRARLKSSICRIDLHPGWLGMKHEPWGPIQLAARWEDVAWFDDFDQDVVRLKVRDTALLDIRIPTADEKDRVAVLDILVQKGVPRMEP
jgi:hypothetical protein